MRFEISAICSSVKLFSTGCSVTSNASERPSAVSKRSNRRTPVISALVGAADRPEQVVGRQLGRDDEGEIASDRLQRRRRICRPRMAACARCRDGVEIDFGRHGAGGRIERFGQARVQLAESCDDGLGTEPELCRAAGMPGRSGVRDRPAGSRPALRQHRAARAPRPWRRTDRTAAPCPICQPRGCRSPASNKPERRMLAVAEIAPADLEQPHRRCAPIEVAPRRGDQARQQRRAA